MRSSSIKTLASALSLFALLVTAVPAADARPAQARETSNARKRDEARESNSIAKAMQRLVQRLFGGVASNGLPSVPITGPGTTTGGGETNGGN